MAKLRLLASGLLALIVLTALSCTAMETEGCGPQIESQHLTECKKFLTQRCWVSCRRHLPECCQEMNRLDKQCVCQGIRKLMTKLQEKQVERQYDEMKEILQKARNLPALCRMGIGRCDIFWVSSLSLCVNMYWISAEHILHVAASVSVCMCVCVCACGPLCSKACECFFDSSLCRVSASPLEPLLLHSTLVSSLSSDKTEHVKLFHIQCRNKLKINQSKIGSKKPIRVAINTWTSYKACPWSINDYFSSHFSSWRRNLMICWSTHQDKI